MGHMIESAKSGRAKCRGCREKIAKGEPRFGHEVPNDFSDGDMTYRWFHVTCAARKQPIELGKALEDFEGELPDKEDLLAAIEKNKKNVKPGSFPYAERAPSSRSKCIGCEEKIEKEDLRVAVEREIDTGSFTRSGAGYLHVTCALEFTGEDDLLSQVTANSTSLTDEDVQVLGKVLA